MNHLPAIRCNPTVFIQMSRRRLLIEFQDAKNPRLPLDEKFEPPH
jgi:hypothetical protein